MFNLLNNKSQFLEEELFNTILTTSFFSIILFTLNAIFVIGDPPIIITNTILTFIIGGMWWTVKYKGMYRQMILPFGFVILLGINLVWFISGGYDSPNGYILTGILIVVIIVSRHKYSKLFIIFIVINVITLFTIEYFNPEIVIEYPKNIDIISQGIIFIFVLITVNYLIVQLKKSYDDERNKVSIINNDLTKKNLEIESKNLIITSQNKALKSYSDELEKKVEKRTAQLSELNEELTKQNLTLEQFTFITAHNLRAPIAQIKGLINLIPKELLISELSQETFNRLENSAMKMDEVISDITNILNIRKGGKKYELINLKNQIELTISTLSDEINEKNIQIELIGDFDIYIAGIHAYMQSVFYNLIHNAIKYSAVDRKSQIKITITDLGNMVQIEIRDNGIGIDMKYASEKIFQLYQRFNTEYQGKGFGLFLSKTQIEAMNGKITVSSELYKGTTFTLIFHKS